MNTNEIQTSGTLPENEEYIRAVSLNRKIITSAQLAQQSLYEMCAGFKEMRDSKLYKQLGYDDFGDYCEKETAIKRSQAYNYISIYENLPEELVHSGGQIGIKKLYLLSTLSEQERGEITESSDLENISARELEEKVKEIKKLREKCDQLTFELEEKSSGRADGLSDALREISELKAALEEEKKTKVLPAPELSEAEKEEIRKTIEAEAEARHEEEIKQAVEKEREKTKEAEKKAKETSLILEERKRAAQMENSKNRKLEEKIRALETEKAALQAAAKKPLPSSEKERVKVHLQIMLDNFNAAAGITAGTSDETERAALKKGLVKAAEQIKKAAEGV